MSKKSIVMIDDHHLVAQGIARFFESNPDLEVISVMDDPKEALEKIPLLKPDIVLTDLDMPGLNGLELIQKLSKIRPETKFVLLTMHLNQEVIKKVLEMKLDGYLPKNADEEEFKLCLAQVSQGKTYYSQKAIAALSNQSAAIQKTGFKKTQNLSARETEVLTLIAEGLSTREIADKLFIAVRTVETHRKAILEKLEVNNVAGMVRIAVQEGLV
ncbi:MAG: response regulator transcription factor [Cyclobacteriaceae bacterium]